MNLAIYFNGKCRTDAIRVIHVVAVSVTIRIHVIAVSVVVVEVVRGKAPKKSTPSFISI